MISQFDRHQLAQLRAKANSVAYVIAGLTYEVAMMRFGEALRRDARFNVPLGAKLEVVTPNGSQTFA